MLQTKASSNRRHAFCTSLFARDSAVHLNTHSKHQHGRDSIPKTQVGFAHRGPSGRTCSCGSSASRQQESPEVESEGSKTTAAATNQKPAKVRKRKAPKRKGPKSTSKKSPEAPQATSKPSSNFDTSLKAIAEAALEKFSNSDALFAPNEFTPELLEDLGLAFVDMPMPPSLPLPLMGQHKQSPSQHRGIPISRPGLAPRMAELSRQASRSTHGCFQSIGTPVLLLELTIQSKR